ncbi:cytochrome c biogenesis protein CcsA [Mucilaginibacter sp. OK098]|uniref:cytochrome c biogenesis protein CcsA n=1 Tax=Mucilaginibacter sp. OK098 TaxID=1855297 RepID=UPI000917948F|nr:cytochrome c biogenesis protein CcsA [Mucilaginibacter sp. OK098]SHM96319.1 cytochrome c-type biogenesis protein CcmF [Mucilaginibacter sp. OK098]
MDIAFQGEHLLPGDIGKVFVILSFGAALLSALSYYFATTSTNKLDNSWLKMGRIAFWANSISILGVGVMLFYVIYNHYFEYHYAWAYTSRSLPVYYIVSGFWNGQEGGFLLWTFWQAVLGNVLIWRAKSWEKPVMTIISFSQVFLASMLLGIEVFGARIGSSPFLLLRNAVEGPIFSRADYLSFIKDGQGMNPLLQNYWMVIHPPTLFLGLASVVVPFAYAIAGLWQKRYKEWVAPAISYGLFSAMILGTGVIMGSLWAYESLNFGGFWAWDPVENASIFPWLTLVGGLHVLIVYKNSGHSYFTATFLVLMSFVMVLYSSFLARSGVLGETSVHAFTDLGMFWHLVIFILVFLALSVYLLVVRWKEMPISKKDEDTYSREFWMFVGAIFLGLSCFHLILVTSIPVWNSMFGTKIAPPTDLVGHYNVIQASFAMVIVILTGFTQFLKYKKTDVTRFFITTGLYLVFAAAITALVVYVTGLYKLHFVFVLVMFGSIYSVLANGKVLTDSLKGKFKLAGSAVAHIGFALMLIGSLIAAGTRKVVSNNESGNINIKGFDRGSTDAKVGGDIHENIMMYRNEPVKMGPYTVTYIGDSVSVPNYYYKMDYKRLDAGGKIVEEFVLKPNAQINPQMGLVSSPDTKHYLFHDLYTHITAIPEIKDKPAGSGDEAAHGEENDDKNYEEPIPHEVAVGDTIPYKDGYIVLKSLNKEAKVQNIPLTGDDIAISAKLEVVSHTKIYQADPVYMIKNKTVLDFARKVEDAGLKLRLSKIIPDKNKVEIIVYQQPQNKRPWIVMRALDFPYINFLWSGTIIMIIGFLLSIRRRNKELKTV